MQTLFEKNQISLKLLGAFISHIEDRYPDEASRKDGADNLLTVLRIYKWHLMQYAQCKAATWDQLATLKHGAREAELILVDILENESARMAGWYSGGTAKNTAQRIANMLSQIILELTKEITLNEEIYPELKDAFDRERESYRKMKSEAEEAA
jgi:hypothetical protein